MGARRRGGRRLLRRLAVALVVSGTVACGEAGADGVGDAGAPGPDIPWLEAGEPPIAPPDIPWLEAGEPPVEPPRIPWLEAGVPPIAWDCPGGWRPVERDAVRTCEPYLEGGPTRCPPGEAHFPGTEGCAPIGRACDGGVFPPVDDVPAGAPVLFVRAGAAPGGDGSRTAPLDGLPAALAVARPGTEIVLAAGLYEVDGPWPAGVHARGRCAADTRLLGAPGLRGDAVVRLASGDTRIRDLTVGPDPRRGVVLAGAGTRLALQGVRVVGVRDRGLLVEEGATLEATSLVVTDVQALPGEPRTRGIEARSGGQLVVSVAVVARNVNLGVATEGAGTTATLTQVAVRDTRDRPDGGGGGALQAIEGSRLVAEDATLSANASRGASAFHDGTVLVLRRVAVRDVRASPGTSGPGVFVVGSASAQLEQVVIDGTSGVGVLARSQATAQLTDTVVRDVRPIPGQGGTTVANAVALSDGASAVVRRALFRRLGTAGVAAYGAPSLPAALRLEDVAVLDVTPRDDGLGGFGVSAQGGATAALVRVRIAGAFAEGVLALGADVSAQDLVVHDVESEAATGRSGVGVGVYDGARFAGARIAVEDTRQGAVYAYGEGSEVELAHFAARRTRAPAIEPDAFARDALSLAVTGAGLAIAAGAHGDVRHALVEDSEGIGVLTWVGEGFLALRDAVVRRTRRARNGAGGVGLIVQLGARARLERMLVEDAPFGVSMSQSGAGATFADLVVRGRDGGALVGAGADLGGDRGRFRSTGGYAVSAFGRMARLTLRDARATGRGPLGSTGGGVVVGGRAGADLTRVGIRDVGRVGLLVTGDATHVGLEDVHVADVRERDPADGAGRLVSVQLGATVDGGRVLLERGVEAGVVVQHPGTKMALDDVVVRGIGAPTCGGGCVPPRLPGVGVSVHDGADASLTRFVVRDAVACGLHMLRPGVLSLVQGRVGGSAAGVCHGARPPSLGDFQDVVLDGNGDVTRRAGPTAPVPLPEPTTIR